MPEFALSYSLGAASGEGKCAIEDECISIMPSMGEPLRIPFRDMLGVSPADYKIAITLPKNTLILSGLGLKYEDFVRELFHARNELTLKDMLMEDAKVIGRARCPFSYVSEGKESKGECEARVYETSLVILPDSGELARIPFCEVSLFNQEGYSLVISTEYGEKLTLSALGRQMDPLRKAVSDAMNSLSLKTQKILKDAAPEAGPDEIAAAARMMRDGRAARRKSLDGISPAIWAGLRKKIEVAGLKDEYAFLESISEPAEMCIGVKRSLMGDMEGEYIWFLAPLKGKNVIAMEATSEESGRATYLFRVMPEKEFRGELSEENILAGMRRINRCMIAINFRREPVYLDEKSLDDPKYASYRFSIARLPQLRELRSLFIGRAIHNEGWKRSVAGQ